MQRGKWENRISNQISVVKKDKSLLEMQNCLRPAPGRFPWHMHADGKDEGYSRIRLVAVGYSRKKKGDRESGEQDNKKSVSVYANLKPEQIKFLFARLCFGFEHVELTEHKFFADEDSKTGTVTILDIRREPYDSENRKRSLPWIVNIRNGTGGKAQNVNGGQHCRKGTYQEKGNVTVYLNDEEMFGLLSSACAVIHAFEQRQLYRERDVKNFQNLFSLIKKELDRRLPYSAGNVRSIGKAA